MRMFLLIIFLPTSAVADLSESDCDFLRVYTEFRSMEAGKLYDASDALISRLKIAHGVASDSVKDVIEEIAEPAKTVREIAISSNSDAYDGALRSFYTKGCAP